MERTLAVKKLGKLLGKSFGYRVNDKASTAEERAAAQADLPAAIAKRKELQSRIDERRQAILAADVEYQALRAAYEEARKQADELSYTARSYKLTVGTSNSMFFHIRAEGDSWEEVIKKIAA